MIEGDFYVEPASWSTDRELIEPVRVEVFIREQGVPEQDEWDDEDPRAQHFVARAVDSSVIGTARLTPAGRFGRLAVLRPWRGRGVGAALLRSALEAARLRGLPEVVLAAQVQAVDFYARAGFQAHGDTFDDAGLPHRWMRLELEPPAQRADPRTRRTPTTLNGKQVVPFADAAGYRHELLRLIGACENRLALYTRDLEPRITNDGDTLEAFSALVTGAARPEVRVLVQDARVAARSGHRLIDLAQRLPSVIAFRKPHADDLDYPSVFAIADRAHVLFRPLARRFEGELRIGHRRDVKQLLEYFDRVWEEARIDPNLRRLEL